MSNINTSNLSVKQIAKIGLNEMASAGRSEYTADRPKIEAIADNYLKAIEDSTTKEPEKKLAHYAREVAAKSSHPQSKTNCNGIYAASLTLEVLSKGIGGSLAGVIADIALKSLDESNRYNDSRREDDVLLGETYLQAIATETGDNNIGKLARTALDVIKAAPSNFEKNYAEHEAFSMIQKGTTGGPPEKVLAQFGTGIHLKQPMADVITDLIIESAQSDDSRKLAQIGKKTQPTLSDEIFAFNTSSKRAPHLDALFSGTGYTESLSSILTSNMENGSSIDADTLDQALTEIENKGSTAIEKVVAHYALEMAAKVEDKEFTRHLQEQAIKGIYYGLKEHTPVSRVLASMLSSVLTVHGAVNPQDEQAAANILLTGIAAHPANRNEKILALTALQLPDGNLLDRQEALRSIARDDWGDASAEKMLLNYGYRLTDDTARDMVLESLGTHGRNMEITETVRAMRKLYAGQDAGTTAYAANATLYTLREKLNHDEISIFPGRAPGNVAASIYNMRERGSEDAQATLGDKYLADREKNGSSANDRAVARTLRQASQTCDSEGLKKALVTRPLFYFEGEFPLKGSLPAALARAAHVAIEPYSGYTYPTNLESCVKTGRVFLKAIQEEGKASESEKLLASTALEVCQRLTDGGKARQAYDACLLALGLMDNKDRAHDADVFESSKTLHELRPDGVLAVYGQSLSRLGDEPVNKEVARLILDKIVEHGKGHENRTLAKSAGDSYRGVFETIFEAENHRTSGLRELAREAKSLFR